LVKWGHAPKAPPSFRNGRKAARFFFELRAFEVIIVEDDPMVAQINQRYLSQVPRLALAGVCHDGLAALELLRRKPVDLVVLDLYMPEMDGLELLRAMRREGFQAEAIMVTAASDAKQIDELLRLGVVDYLVKPFTESRFIEALEKWLARRRALDSANQLSQQAIDSLLGWPSPPAQPAPPPPASAQGQPELPKGLQAATLSLILKALPAPGAAFMSCESLASKSGLSKVTVRRYLNHLAERGAVESVVAYDTGGRPSVKFRLGRLARRS
jgi:response regulator of citrate/malate metabolism